MPNKPSDASFDLVTASLLFQRHPQLYLNQFCGKLPTIEGWREVLILDGNQKTLRHLEWLNNVLRSRIFVPLLLKV